MNDTADDGMEAARRRIYAAAHAKDAPVDDLKAAVKSAVDVLREYDWLAIELAQVRADVVRAHREHQSYAREAFLTEAQRFGWSMYVVTKEEYVPGAGL